MSRTGVVSLSPIFYVFAAALFCSRMGTLSVSFCLPWLLYGKASPTIISVVSASVVLPYIFSPWLSKLPDRYDFRWLLLLFELVQAPLTIGAYFLVMRSAFVLLIAALLISGAAEALSGLITDFYLVPYLAAGGSLTRANGVTLSATQVAPLASPLVAGLLIAVHAAAFVFFLNSVTYLFTAVMAAFFASRPYTPSRRPTTPIITAIKEIVRYKSLSRLTVSLILYNLSTGAVLLLIVLKAQQIWHLGATGIGVAATTAGVAGAASTWASGRYQHRQFRAYRIGIAVCTIGTLAVTTNSNLWLNMVGFLILYMGEGPVVVAQQTIRQTVIPRHIFGIVNGCIRAALIAAVPLARLMLSGMTMMGSLTTAGLPFTFVAAVALIAALCCQETVQVA